MYANSENTLGTIYNMNNRDAINMKHILKFGKQNCQPFFVFQREIDHPLHFMYAIFEIPAEHGPQGGFLQVMHIYLAASCSMTFSVFSREISVDGRIGLNILSTIFSCTRHASGEEWICVYSIIFQSTFETTFLLDAIFVRFL